MSGKRFLERDDIERLIRLSPDFTIRWKGLHVLLVGGASILSVAALLLLYCATDTKGLDPVYGIPLFLMLFVTMGLVLAFHICFTRITHVEFLSLLFASAARVGTEFVVILNRRGIIIYCDEKYNALFSDLFDIRDFQDLLAQEGMKKEDGQKLLSALTERESVAVPFSYKDKQNQLLQVNLTLQPLPRPASYNVLRATLMSSK
jgi:hypothetical protein